MPEERENNYNFWKDLIDNDTLIITGLLIIAGFAVPDIQKLIVGGLLAIMGNLGRLKLKK